jgi:hypothetical protein
VVRLHENDVTAEIVRQTIAGGLIEAAQKADAV